MRPTKFYAWSYSRWKDYAQCPARARWKHLAKLPEPKAEALERGSAIHEKAAKAVVGGRIPAELKLVADWVRRVRKLKPKTELQAAFDNNWKYTGWFDANARCRMVVDVFAELSPTKILIGDWKTGKIREEENQDQLELYAAGGFSLNPGAHEVHVELVYVDHGYVTPTKIFKHTEAPAIQKKWQKTVAPMLADTTFAPLPGNHCRWCNFSKAKNGPCPF